MKKTIGHSYLETDITSTPKCCPNTPDLLLQQLTQNLPKTNHQFHCRIPHPLHKHLLPCPALDQVHLNQWPYRQYQQQQQHQLPSLSPMFSSFYRTPGYRLEHSPLKSRISQPTRLQPLKPLCRSPHPDPLIQKKQHDSQQTTMETSGRETHGSGSYTSTSKRKTSPMTRKS